MYYRIWKAEFGRVMEFEDESVHRGKTFSLDVSFKQGISSEVCKKIVKLIKDQKLKVQATIQAMTMTTLMSSTF